MASSKIIIEQGGISGQPGQARDDIVIGALVTLTNANNNGVRSWRWLLVDRPRGSTVGLSNVVGAQPTFIPDVTGTYLVRLSVNGANDGEVSETIVAVRNAPVTVGADTYSPRYIGAEESTEANWTVNLGGGPQPNDTGWWADFDIWCRLIYGLASSGVPSVSPWGAVLADGNESGATSPIVSDGAQVHYRWTGTAAPQTATNQLSAADNVITAAFDVPIYAQVAPITGGGGTTQITEIAQPPTAGADQIAEVEINAVIRTDTGGGVDVRPVYIRVVADTSVAWGVTRVDSLNGPGVFLLQISVSGASIILNYRDLVAGVSSTIHGTARVAASLTS